MSLPRRGLPCRVPLRAGYIAAAWARPANGQVCTKRCELAHRARGVDLRRGHTGCSTCGITPDVLAHDAGPKLNLKISVDNLLASAQVLGAAEVAWDNIAEFPVE